FRRVQPRRRRRAFELRFSSAPSFSWCHLQADQPFLAPLSRRRLRLASRPDLHANAIHQIALTVTSQPSPGVQFLLEMRAFAPEGLSFAGSEFISPETAQTFHDFVPHG